MLAVLGVLINAQDVFTAASDGSDVARNCVSPQRPRPYRLRFSDFMKSTTAMYSARKGPTTSEFMSGVLITSQEKVFPNRIPSG